MCWGPWKEVRAPGRGAEQAAVQSLGGPSGPPGLDSISVTPGELFNSYNLHFPCCPFVNWENLETGSTPWVFV